MKKIGDLNGAKILKEAKGVVKCDCVPGGDTHILGVPLGCEYHDHHCDECHKRGNCTKLNCKMGDEAT